MSMNEFGWVKTVAVMLGVSASSLAVGVYASSPAHAARHAGVKTVGSEATKAMMGFDLEVAGEHGASAGLEGQLLDWGRRNTLTWSINGDEHEVHVEAKQPAKGQREVEVELSYWHNGSPVLEGETMKVRIDETKIASVDGKRPKLSFSVKSREIEVPKDEHRIELSGNNDDPLAGLE